MMVLWTSYLSRIWPGFLAFSGLLFALRGRGMAAYRLVVYLLLFILFRDAMSLSGLWHLGGGPFLWMRFARDPVSIFALGVFSGLFVLALWRFERDLARGVKWKKKSWGRSLAFGSVGGLAVSAPIVIAGFFVSPWVRGGEVPFALWPAILWLSLLGNLLEELLFRGFLQTHLVPKLGEHRAALASAVAFAAAHGFLAAQLAGWGGLALIAFTFYEGMICAWLKRREALLAAAIAHGLGIFIVSTGLP